MTQDQTPDPIWLSDKPDDDELARAIAQLWNETVRFLYGQWYLYDGGVWSPRSPLEMQMGLREVLRNFRLQRVGIQINIGQTRVAGLARMMQSDLFLPDREYDALLPEQERYINLKNGLYNLDSFEMEKHNPALRFTTQLDFEYDADAKCPTWQRFLDTSLLQPGEQEQPDEQLIALVQESIAYSMTARTDLKASFWLVGERDSGKSTLIAFLRGLMGNLHTTIDLNQLGGNRFLLSGIVGKRVVTFTEASDNSVLPDALYKAMVGGVDEIYADVKNRPGIAFKPIAKFWWAMNSAPRMTDRSGATLNRLKVIPFNRTIPVARRIGNLYQLLMRERPGIFNWLLDGYARLAEKGQFTLSDQSEAWREGYRLENDTEATFINECAERGTGTEYRVKGEILYRTYKRWCEENGFRAKNSNQVSKDWERLGFFKTRINGSTWWHNFRLTYPPDRYQGSIHE